MLLMERGAPPPASYREIVAHESSATSETSVEALTAEAVARRSYEDQIAGVPEQYRCEADLNAARDVMVETIADRQQALADADAQAQTARELAATANADLKNAEKTKTDTEKRCN